MRTPLAASIALVILATEPSAAQEGAKVAVKAKNSAATRICAVNNPSQCKTVIHYYTLDVVFAENGNGSVIHRGKWDKFRIGVWKSVTLANGKPLKYVFMKSAAGYQVTASSGLTGIITIKGNKCELRVSLKNERVTGTSKTFDSHCTVARA